MQPRSPHLSPPSRPRRTAGHEAPSWLCRGLLAAPAAWDARPRAWAAPALWRSASVSSHRYRTDPQ